MKTYQNNNLFLCNLHNLTKLLQETNLLYTLTLWGAKESVLMAVSQINIRNKSEVEENVLPSSERYKGSRTAIGLS